MLCKIHKVTIQPTEPSILFGPPYFRLHINTVSGLWKSLPSDLRRLSHIASLKFSTRSKPFSPWALASVFHKKLKACLFYLSFLPWPLYCLDNTWTDISSTDLAMHFFHCSFSLSDLGSVCL
jgi:hypothetical protein